MAKEPFLFLQLPDLIQWKILRQYVDTLTKVVSLSQMDEFSEVLSHPEAWLSRLYSPWMPFLGALEVGFYVPRSLVEYEHGITVSSPVKNTILFQFGTDETLFTSHPKTPVVCDEKTSLAYFREFLFHFLKQFTSRRQPLLVYNQNPYSHINRSLPTLPPKTLQQCLLDGITMRPTKKVVEVIFQISEHHVHMSYQYFQTNGMEWLLVRRILPKSFIPGF